MKKLLSRSILIGQALFVLLIILSSCKKNPLEIGLDLIPSSDTLQALTCDTTTINAYSELIDSVRTDETTTFFLGSMVDPVFGKTTVSFGTQFNISEEAFSFGTNAAWDSLVLSLAYAGYTGDIMAPITIKVYEINEDLDKDTSYYSNRPFVNNNIELASMTFYPQPKDSILLDGAMSSPHLRINLTKLTPSFADKLMNASADNMLNSTNFQSFMKGLCIITEPVSQGGCLLTFNPVKTFSRLSMYYHNTDTKGDSLRFDYPIGETCARYMKIDHDYQGASIDFKNQVINHDTTMGKNKIYLQPMAGVRTKISFPFLKEYSKNGKIAIHEARLVLKNYDPGQDTSVPTKLAFMKFDKDGNVGYIIDELEGAAYFNGSYDKSSHEYYFRLTRHLQKMLEDYYTTPFELYLLVDSPLLRTLSNESVVLTGQSPDASIDPGERMQLKIIYTKLY